MISTVSTRLGVLSLHVSDVKVNFHRTLLKGEGHVLYGAQTRDMAASLLN